MATEGEDTEYRFELSMPARAIFQPERKDVERQNIAQSLREVHEPLCLWMGSPVYVDHAVPPVEAFLDDLPPLKGAAGVPFVTWGAVSSGGEEYFAAQEAAS